jgi:hypothetical protein
VKAMWAGSLAMALAVTTCSVHAQDTGWRPQGPSAPAASAAPLVTLGKPVPLRPSNPNPNMGVLATSYNSGGATILQTQATDPLAPPAVPPPGLAPPVPVPVQPPASIGGPPVIGPDPLWGGGCVDQPANLGGAPAGNGFWDKCVDTVGGHGNFWGTHNKFESDHGFDGMVSPVSNPFFFEDPRSLTEARPLFMFQAIPHKNTLLHGGDIEYVGIQGRVAFTERWSFVVSELGGIFIQPNTTTNGFADASSFAQVTLGPKFTFIRDENSGTVAAMGLNFQFPTGSQQTFQDTGTLSLEPYFSLGQSFGRTSYGNANFLMTSGFDFATDNQRSDFFFASLHLDYGFVQRIYPLVELNWFSYLSGGNAHDFGFEGRDLFNFGSRHVASKNDFTMALGMRYKFNNNVQAGGIVEFPLSGSSNQLMDYRLGFDVIFRY